MTARVYVYGFDQDGEFNELQFASQADALDAARAAVIALDFRGDFVYVGELVMYPLDVVVTDEETRNILHRSNDLGGDGWLHSVPGSEVANLTMRLTRAFEEWVAVHAKVVPADEVVESIREFSARPDGVAVIVDDAAAGVSEKGR